MLHQDDSKYYFLSQWHELQKNLPAGEFELVVTLPMFLSISKGPSIIPVSWSVFESIGIIGILLTVGEIRDTSGVKNIGTSSIAAGIMDVSWGIMTRLFSSTVDWDAIGLFCSAVGWDASGIFCLAVDSGTIGIFYFTVEWDAIGIICSTFDGELYLQ